MTIEELTKQLQAIVAAHPEAAAAQVWVEIEREVWDREEWVHRPEILHSHTKYVRFDKRHHPARIILE